MTVSIFLMPSLLQANKAEDCFFRFRWTAFKSVCLDSVCVAQTDLESMILLPQSPEC